MGINLRGRSFLTLRDFSPEEIRYLLDLSRDLKLLKRAGVRPQNLLGKNIVLLFEKTSTRTRCAFEVAAFDEGAHVTFLGMGDSQFGKKESIEDSAKVLGRMYDAIEFRGYAQETVEALAKHSGVPVYNGLTDKYHPTQILADWLTVSEHIMKPFSEIKWVFVGDTRSNMANSLMIGATKLGAHFVNLGPRELSPQEEILTYVQGVAKETGAKIEVTEDIEEAVRGADVIYTDVWVSMGEEHLFEERIHLLEKYRVDSKMMEQTGNPHSIFLHCLPAFHDLQTALAQEVFTKFGLKEMEVSDSVFRSRASKVFDQAENRLHTIKAIMVATL